MEPASKDPRLSVAIIARNCARPLVETIASIRPIADEIVVLDTGSTDDTLVAATGAGAAVHRRPWDDDFAAARNACLEHVRGRWVLWLDAGETLDASAARELAEFVAQRADIGQAYLLSVALPSAAGQIGCEQIARLRLHPRRDGLRFAGRVRESLEACLAALAVRVEALPYVIQRGPSDLDAAVKASRAQRNIRLADLQLAEQGPTAPLHNVLGEAFQSLGDQVRAAQHYRRAIDLAVPASREHLEAFYGLLTCLDGASADRTDQMSLCMLALEHFPLDAQLLVALGGYLQALDQTPLAIRSFDVAFRHGQTERQIWHLPEIREIAASCAAAAFIQSGDHEQGRTLLEAAVRTCPHSQRLALQLIELHVEHRRRDEALAAAGGLPSPAVRERLEAAVRGACLAQQGNWAAATDLLQAAMLDGCRERFCLRWLVVSWLAERRPLEAQAALRTWQAFDSQSPLIAPLAEQIAAMIAELDCTGTSSVRVDDAGSSGGVGPRKRPQPSGPSQAPVR